MLTDKEIKKFSAKHLIDHIESTGDGVQRFSGERFFSDEDIVLDLEKEVPVGLIELYMHEATEGHVQDFESWLTEHKFC